MSQKIEWTHIPKKGRGVIAGQDIPKNEIVEISPVIPISRQIANYRALDNYSFSWGEEIDDPDPHRACAIGLGYLSLYNHSSNSNVSLQRSFANDVMIVTAKRDIKAGEELTINYDIELWFEEA